MTLLAPAAGTELLDDPDAPSRDVCRSLRNIGRANRWFGGAAAVRFGLARALASIPPGRPLTLLDVGTGLGDLPRMAAEWASRRGILLHPVGLERHAAAARLARDHGLQVAVGDGGALPLRSGSVDLVLLSQVAHHFDPPGIVHLVRECNRVARHAVIVSDLRRSVIAALGFLVAGHLMGFDRHTVNDGVTSLRRGFTAASLASLLGEAGVTADVARRPGARLVAVWHPAS
ncbi:MAG TPA: methyltransferase domain-containing protein [Gemmatimonadales bacterium]